MRVCLPVLMILLVSACAREGGSDPSAPVPAPAAPATESRSSRLPTEAQLEAYVKQGPDPTLRAIQSADYWLQFQLMRATGVEQALGGERQAVAALKALGDAYERKLRAAELELPRMIPTMTGEGLTSGFTGMGIGSFVSTITSGMLSGSISSMSDQQLSELIKAGPVRSNGESGSAEMQLGQDGSLTQSLDFTVNESGLSGKVRTRVRMDTCPDANGRVAIDVEVDSQMSVTDKPGTGGYVHTEFKYERYLNDDAHLISSDDGMASHLRIRLGGHENSESQATDITLGIDRSGKGFFEERDAHGFGIFRPEDSDRALKLVSDTHVQQMLMAEAMLRGLGSRTGSPWEGGRCIDLKVTSTPAQRMKIRPNTAFDLEAIPRVKQDGAPAGGTVTATLTGGSSLFPASGKVKADARYQYAGPDQKNERATITFEARSKRGVGRASLAFDTVMASGYVMKGGAKELQFSGQVCDLGGVFQLRSVGGLNDVTMTFEPATREGGRYRYKGTMTGYDSGERFTFPVHGSGTYQVKFDGETAVSAQTQGRGTVETPFGPQTATGTESYTLTPSSEGCSQAP